MTPVAEIPDSRLRIALTLAYFFERLAFCGFQSGKPPFRRNGVMGMVMKTASMAAAGLLALAGEGGSAAAVPQIPVRVVVRDHLRKRPRIADLTRLASLTAG